MRPGADRLRLISELKVPPLFFSFLNISPCLDALQDSVKLAFFKPRVFCDKALTVRIGSRLAGSQFAFLAGLSAAHGTSGSERSYGIHALSCQTLVKKYGQF